MNKQNPWASSMNDIHVDLLNVEQMYACIMDLVCICAHMSAICACIRTVCMIWVCIFAHM